MKNKSKKKTKKEIMHPKLYYITMLFILFASINGQTPIIDCAGLQDIQSNLNTSYFLAQDIDCVGVTFVPIGNTTNPFTGKN